MHIQDIPQKFVPEIAKLLQFRPNEDPEALSLRIVQGAKSLPSSLRSSRLENFLLPSRGHLCPLHKCLHHDVVRSVLHHVQLEVGIRLNNVISHSEMLTPELSTRIKRLRELHALWLDRREYRRTFMASSRDLKWRYQTDRCEACILSKITSDLQILLDLRWAFRSRATRVFVAKYGNPRLQQWVHVWIATLAGFVEEITGTDIDLDMVILHNDEEAILMKKTRAEIDAFRQQTHQYKKSGPANGAYMTEVPYDWSYPVRSAPHRPKPQEMEIPVAQDASEVQPEEFIGDTNEAYLEGRSPYHQSESERDSGVTIRVYLDERLHVVTEDDQDTAYEVAQSQLDYVSPRSLWEKPEPREPALVSSTLLPRPDTPQSPVRPSSVKSTDTWERSTVPSRSSWDTEQCVVEDCGSSVYSSSPKTPGRNEYMSPSQSWRNLSRVAEEQTNARSTRQTRRSLKAQNSNPAETYTNLLKSSPFAESNAGLRQATQPKKQHQQQRPSRPEQSFPGVDHTDSHEQPQFVSYAFETGRPRRGCSAGTT
ncbi:hypothetical protein PV04_02416 [Phialophora macrospora]|uniref:Uncharacterized protein n=1 Tax=Phialophora macrospora TaxID=1851006 RepID=A0A0D2FUA9_9EURO|nr:hypothetical protein PV04_02416 [Phialophora macrospora]